MQEICQSGSEGGGADIRSPYPYIVVTWVLAGERKSATPSYENKHQHPRDHQDTDRN